MRNFRTLAIKCTQFWRRIILTVSNDQITKIILLDFMCIDVSYS